MVENRMAATDSLRRWLHDAHSPAHSRRTAGTNAGFFLPHLKPSMRLLDAGCGPGSITVGLARAVAPGGVVGIDANPAAVRLAKAAAHDAGVPNVSFNVAVIHGLPFRAESFDAVFVHAVLQHLPDGMAALRCLRGVLRPGGVIGVADADYGGSILWPHPPEMERALALMTRVRQAAGGDVYAGRKLGTWLAEAGFASIEAGATASADGTSEAAARIGAFWERYFSSRELVRHAETTGLATSEEMFEAAAAWKQWGATAGAFWARFWCHAVARNPR